jgi:predicted DNA-binding transcriptional regulator YafY
VVLDPSNWDRGQMPPPPHLVALQQAVIDGVQVSLDYGRRDGARSLRVVHPWGLVVKNQVWYLIAGTASGQRTFRVSRVLSVDPTNEPVQRPEGFDLEAAWHGIMSTLDEKRAPATVRVQTDVETLDILRYMFGTRLVSGPVDAMGRIEAEIRGHSEEAVARQLSGLGGRFEVLSPPSLRTHLADIGRTLTEHYGTSVDGSGSAGGGSAGGGSAGGDG